MKDGLYLLKEKIQKHTGFCCSGYKERPLKRRLAVRMRARQVKSYEEYSCILDKNPEEYSLLLDTITINLSKFFRNSDVYGAIEEKVFPEWRSKRRIVIWSAGCACGEEAYSLAILIEEGKRKKKLLDFVDVSIFGTDIDEEVLRKAREGRYEKFALSECPKEIVEEYFVLENGVYCLSSEIKGMVSFFKKDLLSEERAEEPILSNLDMILCRNVLIYLEREAQEYLFSEFYRCLRDGGFLVLGKVETLLGEPRKLFKPVALRERIFRKI